MKIPEAGTKIGDNVVESVTINTKPSDEAMEEIKKKVENEDYELIIKSLNNGEEFTIGWKFAVIDKESNEIQQYGDYIKVKKEDLIECGLHECIDLMTRQCKDAKQTVI